MLRSLAFVASLSVSTPDADRVDLVEAVRAADVAVRGEVLNLRYVHVGPGAVSDMSSGCIEIYADGVQLAEVAVLREFKGLEAIDRTRVASHEPPTRSLWVRLPLAPSRELEVGSTAVWLLERSDTSCGVRDERASEDEPVNAALRRELGADSVFKVGAWGRGVLLESTDSTGARIGGLQRFVLPPELTAARPDGADPPSAPRSPSANSPHIDRRAARLREHMATIVFDIEVAGFPWEEVDEITRGYLLSRARSPEERDAVPERTALVPGLGKVIAIGMWLAGKDSKGGELDRGMLLLEGESEDEHAWEKVPGSKIFRGDERALLTRFWDTVAPAGKPKPQLVSFNGRGYDGPILSIRSAQLGIRPSRQMVPNRYAVNDHCDLADVLTFQGATREHYKLDYWCRRFDIESPKGSIDGSQVGRAYREGKIEDIGEYCLRDVRATAQLYRKLEPTILPLFAR